MFNNKAKKKRSTPPDLFRMTKTPEPIKRKAEFWLDVFQGTLSDLVSQKHEAEYSPASYAEIVTKEAGLIADEAINRYEERWPGVLIP